MTIRLLAVLALLGGMALGQEARIESSGSSFVGQSALIDNGGPVITSCPEPMFMVKIEEDWNVCLDPYTSRKGITEADLMTTVTHIHRLRVSPNNNLPDAPSAIHCQNGDPPKKGAEAWLVGACPFDVAPTDMFASPPRPGHDFLVFRGLYRDSEGHRRYSWNAPLLKFNKKIWALWGGSVALGWIAYAHSGEHCHSECAGIVVVDGLSLFTGKAFTPVFVVAPAIASSHYLKEWR